MIEFFLRRRVIGNLITLFIVLVGGWQAWTVRREAFPDIKFDIVTITTAYPGGSPEEVETLVTRPIEEELKGVSGIDRVESYSIENQSLLVTRLDENLSEREKDRTVTDIHQAVARVEDLPEVSRRPVVEELTAATHRPLLTLSVAGGTDDERDRFAEEMKDLIEAVPGVSRVKLDGDRKREVIVEVDRTRLDQNRLTMAEVAAAIRRNNVDRSAGAVQAGPLEHWVRVRSGISTAHELGDIAVRSNDERTVVRLRDLAQVREGFADQRIHVRAGGKPAIDLQVSKHKTGDAIRLADAVKKIQREQTTRAADKKIELILSDDLSFFIKRRLRVMTSNLVQGGALILAALFIFLDWRLAVVAAWGVPISFAAAMLVAVPLGFTINLMSLLAFIIVLGMLDDDSVVVAENIYRHLEQGKPALRAAIDGTREVLLPVIGSVMVSCCAFLPFALMSGIMGKFLMMIPLIVCMCFVASVFEAFFILPSHVLDLMRYGRPVEEMRESRWYAAAVGKYRRAAGWVLQHRLKFAGLLAAFLAGTVLLAAWRIKFVLFPPGLIDQFFIQLEMPPGTNLNTTASALQKIEEAVLSLPRSELDAVTSRVGMKGWEDTARTGTQYAQARVFLSPEDTRPRKTKTIVEDLRRKIGLPPGAMKVSVEEMRPGPPVGQAVFVRTRGPEPGVNRAIADEIKAELAKIPGIYDVRDSLEAGKKQWLFTLDAREAAFAGLDAERVSLDLFYAVDGVEVSKIQRPDEEVDIRLKLLPQQRSNPADLLALEVLNLQGRPVHLGSVSRVLESQGPPVLQRYNFHPAVSVTSNVDLSKNTSREVNNRIQKRFQDLPKRHPGYELIYGGEEEETNKSLRSLFRAFGTALLLDFVILATLFGSYVQPFLILLTIPIGLIGVTYALLLHGMPASFMALLGVVAMTGVVVNNAIVLVNFINEKRSLGMGAAEAALEASVDRLRPIWASSITTLLGLFPTAYGFGGHEPFVAPMAMALAWGLTFAMPMTLFIIPAAYVIIDDAGTRLRRLFRFGGLAQ
ncbi:MAG: efflux RND transporter permease subunit [Elusimicrobia bacterium]|nr:efflux RND transporter permease subunit [Elusimicrobiota bacterium]